MKTIHLISAILLISFLAMSCGGHDHKEHQKDMSKEALPTIDYDAKFKELGLQIDNPGNPVANYVNVTQAGNILYLSGKGPNTPEGGYIVGKVGKDLTEKEGYDAARLAGIQHLGVLKEHLGDLNRVKRVLKVLGMVNSTPEFGNQPEVINGYSDLMVEVFGDRGKHARSAIGMGSLPRNIAVEVEVIVEVFE